MSKGALLVLLCGLWAACATTPPPRPPLPSPPRPTGAAVADIAREHQLQSSYDQLRRRWILTGGKDRVLLYPDTTVAVVNGCRVDRMGPIWEAEGRLWVRPEDARKIRSILATPRARPLLPVVTAPKTGEGSATNPPLELPGVRVALGRKWEVLILHHSATSTGNAAAFHHHHKMVRGWDGLGYHFVIGNGCGSGDGELEVGYRWTRQITGAHAGRPPDGTNRMNEVGIGICLVGDFNRTRPTAAQVATLHRLVDFLEVYCGIPESHVLLHRDIRGTECPGRYFPAAEFQTNPKKP